MAKKRGSGIQPPLGFMEPLSDWKAPVLGTLPSWNGARRVAVDVETKDPQIALLGPGVRRPGCHVVGFSFAIEDGPSFYVPLRHEGGGNVDAAQGLAYLREQAENFEGDVCGNGLQYDLDFLAQEGVEFSGARFFRDDQVAAALVDELQRSYSMDAIAGRLGIPGKDEGVLVEALSAFGFNPPHAKRGIYALPARHVGPYGERDASLPLQLLAALEREIDEQELWGVYDLESRVLPILVRMRRRGVRVSLERLDAVEGWSREKEDEALMEVRRLSGVSLNRADTTVPSALARVFRAVGIEPPRTAKNGQPSIKDEWLKGLDHPLGRAVSLARQVNRLRNTFCQSVRTHVVVDPYTGEARIHPTFNQLRRSSEEGSDGDEDDGEGARFGRLSCVDPNLQQQPSPDRQPLYGKMWRSIYLPDDGKLWVSCDYSQQEPRMAIHGAVMAGERWIGIPAARAAIAAAQHFRDDPKTDFHDMMTAMVYGRNIKSQVDAKKFKQLRNFCKQIFLGLSYGMGGPKLCRKLGLPTAWAVVSGRGYDRKKVLFDTIGEAEAASANLADSKVVEAAGKEGQAIIDKFDREVPFVRKMLYFMSDLAKKRGYVTTISGRRCHFPKLSDGSYDWAHKAFNRWDQGSSADQTKAAIVALDAIGIPLQLQVHDEVIWSAETMDEARAGANAMENAWQGLHLPFRCDVEVGESWGEAK